MLNIHNLSVSFSGEYLFKEISFKLISGDRVGLIGKNGAGKSTLLKLLSKENEMDSGSIAYEKDLKIGFLKQDIDFDKGRTVLDEAYQAFTEIKSLEQQQNQINTQLSERTDYESDSYLELINDLSEKTDSQLADKIVKLKGQYFAYYSNPDVQAQVQLAIESYQHEVEQRAIAKAKQKDETQNDLDKLINVS